MVSSMVPEFVPAWWLRSSHAQTIWPTLFRVKEKMPEQWERIELPDGDFLDLVWNRDNAGHRGKSIVVILHGVGGDINSTYVKGQMAAISRVGLRPVLMHFRSASGVPNRFPRGYHSGDTADLAYIVKHLKERDHCPVACVGFSIGANVLLKWLGETRKENPLAAAVAVSVPFDLSCVADTLMHGFARVYQWWIISKLVREKKIKFSKMRSPIDLTGLDRVTNFWQYDGLITAPLFGFSSAKDYYQKSSCRQYLPYIAIPTLIIHAKDDPFMKPASIPAVSEISKTTQLELFERGGHVGFITGDVPGCAKYWLDKRIPAFLDSHTH